ncbi:Fpg/Nei family DNA glycosylase [Agrococcus jenensis]|uniref:DNA-(apurinic or apyrimidinic site) lyase n=1 Tax=Agrococcus jenensis TaxID=46353 RepID=A0A3N2AUI6_9MICO|nr:DNA-formamidopyrimidine glycosylase family protein [Agrococcus jenensis]ROR66697.1 endonuclease-8/formamidopyrimidine-DNA glycosylase [Agrococcus jenensis]
MPEGHSVHRIARQFGANFVGSRAAVTSPQGRFEVGAAELDGRTITSSEAIGKHLLLGFDGTAAAPDRVLHVHLGIYGAWDFAGAISVDPTILASTLAVGAARTGQTGMRGVGGGAGTDGEHEDSIASIGAPRLARLRAGERETASEVGDFPPEPVGQVRVRILTAAAVADLRGPTVCEVLEPAQVRALADRLGPDPEAPTESRRRAEDRFVARAARSGQAIGQLLMDQSVVAGIGNVYRAELLFRARMDPHRPGNVVPEDELRRLWRDWVKLLRIGVETGQMLTIDGLRGARRAAALANRADRHWVYKREGQPCRRCGTSIALETMQGRKLYWCSGCQL